MDVIDGRMTLQPSGYDRRTLAMEPETSGQSLHPLQRKPGLEGSLRRANGLADQANALQQLLIARGNRSANRCIVAVDVFGRREDGDIRAEFQRLLKNRS